jgi:uncharacterized protein YyaL (SSP411 family)
LRSELAHHYLPFALVIPAPDAGPTEHMSRLLPFTSAMTARGGATAYVCRDFACRQPVTTAQDLAKELQ